ncbi:hypothetical protein ABEB36_000250 [Hypothenemus hampei]|uniref:THAP9-like helix-turn-helix domain-containing protein n=1 Tax=Hypothenemus hampei TaxID=57062 RepID=A0ABD1FAM8_HYPHA
MKTEKSNFLKIGDIDNVVDLSTPKRAKRTVQFLKNTVAMQKQKIRSMISRKLSGKTKMEYTPELRTFALTLQFYSAKAYEYVNVKVCDLEKIITT